MQFKSSQPGRKQTHVACLPTSTFQSLRPPKILVLEVAPRRNCSSIIKISRISITLRPGETVLEQEMHSAEVPVTGKEL